MYVRLLLLIGIILAVGFAPAPFPKRPQRPEKQSLLDRLQGWWAHVEERQDGRPGSHPGLRIHINGRELHYYNRESKADGWTIKVDEGTRPPSLDKTRLGTTDDVLLGRISVEGDVMKIGWYTRGERPPDLNGTKGRCITLRRERK